ncbi:MAG: ROK family protein [Candidatus Hydrothermarchaeales archaeon]
MEQDITKPFTIGMDLGGTKVEAGLIDAEGRILSEIRYPTNPDKGADGIVADIIDAVNRLQDQAGQKAGAVGIGAAGQIDSEGVVRSAPNLPFHNEPLQTRLEKELRLPVVVTNDVRAATYGEWRYGSGKGVDDLVVLFVGTGIGGGVVSGGHLLKGCNNTAGELGHITLVAEGRRCRCPNHGCLEAYAGGWAIAERAQEVVLSDPKKGERLKSLAGSVENITATTVSQAYHEGDPLAKKLVEKTGNYLASGVVGIVNAFNPCLLVLGGGVIEGLPELIPIVEAIIRKRALKPSVEKLKIVKAVLGVKAGVIGAAALAYNKVEGGR